MVNFERIYEAINKNYQPDMMTDSCECHDPPPTTEFNLFFRFYLLSVSELFDSIFFALLSFISPYQQNPLPSLLVEL